MLIHFEIHGELGWEALGSGLTTDGSDAIKSAFADLLTLHGGELPAGTYRYIEARGQDARWRSFDLPERAARRLESA